MAKILKLNFTEPFEDACGHQLKNTELYCMCINAKFLAPDKIIAVGCLLSTK
jgi:hypothetical protein